MSGAWTVVEKKSPGGSKYKDLWDDLAVVIPNNKHKAVLLTPKVRSELGDPEHVLVVTNGTKVGIIKSEGANSNSYAVTGKDKMARVSCPVESFMPSFPYGVKFEAWKDGDMVVFDTSDAEKIE